MDISKETQGVSVVCSDLSITIKAKKGAEVSILNEINFATLRGEMTAIMGPSGSGKTTLLNVLAGRISKKMLVHGNVYFNGKEYPPRKVKNFSGYVMQEDRFLEFLTVQETLTFAANLRLKSWSREARKKKVNEILTDMGLISCRDVFVGGPSIKGISGGQRKRVSIGIALLPNPQLLFLDEPTSGLDASLAYDVVKILDNITQTHGRSILCTIHQPRSQVFQLFDTLLLLRAGDVVFRGPAADATKYFSDLGFQCPPEFNPPDFFLDILSTGNTTHEAIRRSSLEKIAKRDDSLFHISEDTSAISGHEPHHAFRVVVSEEDAARFAESYRKSEFAATQKELKKEQLDAPQDIVLTTEQSTSVTPLQWAKSVIILVQRDIRNNKRNLTDFYVNTASMVCIAIVYSTIFWQTPWPSVDSTGCQENSTALRNLLGAYIQPIGNTGFSAFDIALNTVDRRALVNRESRSGLYTHSARFVSTGISDMVFVYWGSLLMCVISYWCLGFSANAARFLTYVVIIVVLRFCANSYAVMCGSFAPNTPVASALVPLGTVLFFFTSGFAIADGDVPNWLKWLKQISYMRFLFQGFARDQLQNDEFLDTCARMETPHGTWKNIGIAFGISCAFRSLAFIAQCFVHKQTGLES